MNFTPFYSTAINPKYTHTLYGVLSAKNKMVLSIIPLPWAHFVFLFLLFKLEHLIIIADHSFTLADHSKS